MIDDAPHYTLMLLFGKGSQTILRPEAFQPLVEGLTAYCQAYQPRLKCRGYILGHSGKNVGPRTGVLSENKISQWLAAVDTGDFVDLEFIDADQSRSNYYPVAFASLSRLSTLRVSESGADNCTTVAIRNDESTDKVRPLEVLLLSLINLTNGFYGFIDEDVPWDVESYGDTRAHMIDLWSREVPAGYCQGRRDPRLMDDYVFGLHLGNLVSPGHLVEAEMNWITPDVATRIERIGTLYYLRFACDPQKNKAFRAMVEPHFNMLPPPEPY